MFGLGSHPWVIPVLLLLVILLFGANKLPGLARNMGESMRIFKSEVSEMKKEGEKDKVEEREAALEAQRATRPVAAREERTYVESSEARAYDARETEARSEELYRRD